MLDGPLDGVIPQAARQGVATIKMILAKLLDKRTNRGPGPCKFNKNTALHR